MAVIGQFEGLAPAGMLTGWATTMPAGRKLEVEILVDGTAIIVVAADQFRRDLVSPQLPDPSCGFVVPLPDECLDGGAHVVEARIVDGDPLPGSPIHIAPTAARDRSVEPPPPKNRVRNADFRSWPHGLTVVPRQLPCETAAGWWFDYRGTSPVRAMVRAERPHGLALADDQYALAVRVRRRHSGGHLRVFGRIRLQEIAGDWLFVDVGLLLRRTVESSPIGVTELFIGLVREGSHIEKVATVRKRIFGSGVVRLHSVPVAIPERFRGPIEEGAELVLCFELAGLGECVVFAPHVTTRSSFSAAPAAATGSFEDKTIHDQVEALQLSGLWRDGVVARNPARLAGGGVAAEPRPQVPATTTTPFVQIVVPVHEAVRDLNALVESVVRHTHSPFELLLVDDGSGAATRGRIAAFRAADPRIRAIANPGNLGYTRAVNIGLQSCVADAVVIANSDVVVTAGWLDKLHAALVSAPDVAGVGPVSNAASWQSVPKVKTRSGEWAVNAVPVGWTVDSYGELVERVANGLTVPFPLLNGFCGIFRRALIAELGWLDDENFPHGYGEETDLCLRLQAAGHRLLVAADTYVFHAKSRSFGAMRRAQLTQETNRAVREKHAGTDFAELEMAMQADAALAGMRRRLLAATAAELRHGSSRVNVVVPVKQGQKRIFKVGAA
jgi:GT2 family glycosyltransferase